MVKAQKTLLVVFFILSIAIIILWLKWSHTVGDNQPFNTLLAVYQLEFKDREMAATFGIKNDKRYITKKNDFETVIAYIEIDGYTIEKQNINEHKIYIGKDGTSYTVVYKQFLDKYTMYYLPYGNNLN